MHIDCKRYYYYHIVKDGFTYVIKEVNVNMTLKVKINEMRTTRIKQGMSIRALGKAAGLSPATIFRIENGITFPVPATAKKICDALKEEFDHIFGIVKKGA